MPSFWKLFLLHKKKHLSPQGALLGRGKGQRRIRVPESPPNPNYFLSCFYALNVIDRQDHKSKDGKRGLFNGRNANQSKGAKTDGEVGQSANWREKKGFAKREHNEKSVGASLLKRATPIYRQCGFNSWMPKTEPFRLLRVDNVFWMFTNLKIKGNRKQAW